MGLATVACVVPAVVGARFGGGTGTGLWVTVGLAGGSGLLSAAGFAAMLGFTGGVGLGRWSCWDEAGGFGEGRGALGGAFRAAGAVCGAFGVEKSMSDLTDAWWLSLGFLRDSGRSSLDITEKQSRTQFE